MERGRSWSAGLRRRASATGAVVLVALGGLVAAAPTAPAAPVAGATGAAVSVVVGVNHTCALTTAGGVRCWGGNSHGELGDGTRTTHRRPADVVGLTSGVAQISARRFTTCAVLVSGTVRCWGAGANGVLGDGGTSDRSTPVVVAGLGTGARSVSVGEVSVCAVTTGGGVKCWGSGAEGGLGNGSTDSSPTPVDVVGLGSGVDAVTTGLSHACALTSGRVRCWGANRYGELGIGNRRSQATPVAVRGDATLTSVTAGRFTTCATAAGGGVSCWGQNNAGWLGVGSDERGVGRPAPVVGLTGVVSLGAGGFVTCAAGAPRTWCWGNNDNGTLGDGTATSRITPVAVTGLPGRTVDVASSDLHTCATTVGGRVFCWGFNSSGQLGDGTTSGSLVPVRVVGLGVA